MIANGRCHSSRRTASLGIIAAHDALQFRKFANHSADKIGFGKACSLTSRRPITSGNRRCNMRRQLCQTRRLVMHRSQPFIKDDISQTRQGFGKRCLAIFLPEKFSISQPCAQHPLITGKDHVIARRICQPVADDNKPRGQPPVFIFCCQIFLMHTDRGFQHLIRQ